MQSLSYVFASYAVGAVLLGGFAIHIIWRRRQLKNLVLSLELQNEKK